MSSRLRPWAALWDAILKFQRNKVDAIIALRNTIGVLLPLIAGVMTGQIAGGLAMSTGALNVCYSDSHDPYRQRARKMLASSVLVGVAVFAGALSGHNHVVAVLVAAIWAFAVGMAVALSTTTSDVANISLVVLLVYAAVPQPLERATYGGLLAFSGGLLQAVLSLAFWPLRRYAPELAALSDLYFALADAATQPIEVTQGPPASAQSTRAQTALYEISRDSIEGARLAMLLNQAERIRLSLMLLGRLRLRLARELPQAQAVAPIDNYFHNAATILAAVADSLRTGRQLTDISKPLGDLQQLADNLRNVGDQGPKRSANIRDTRVQMDALAGQFRAVVDLATSATSPGIEAFEAQESTRPRQLRFASTVATLRANLNLRSSALRHAIRLSVCVAIADALARAAGLTRPYWLPMTVAIVLKPDFTATFSRGVLRLIGTATGLVITTILIHALPNGTTSDLVLIPIFVFVTRCFGPANYGILTAAVTGVVVLLIAMAGVAPSTVIGPRGLNTVCGGVIALAAYWFWPTWERMGIQDTLADLLDAYREYFRSIRACYTQPIVSVSRELDQWRLRSRLARSNFEAAIGRMSSEPGTSPEDVKALAAMLASAHRLIHAFMALDGIVFSTNRLPPRDAFRHFAEDVELTLHLLAAGLRGSALNKEMLPDLREDHHRLVHSSHAPAEQYSLIDVETDRITNSLNTFAEQVLGWVHAQAPMQAEHRPELQAAERGPDMVT